MHRGGWLVCATVLAGCQRFLELQQVTAPADGGNVVAQKFEHEDTSDTSEMFELDIPAANRTVLLVNIGLSSDNTPGIDTRPVIASVSYAGTPMTKFDSIVGVPVQPDTRSELWELTAPPAGINTLDIELASPGSSLHMGALVFAEVDQTTPVRTSQPSSGMGNVGTAMITSMPGDTVVAFIGAGNAITSINGADTIYVDNGTEGYSLDNSAAASTAGSASVMVNWSLEADDNWQAILASLAP